MGCASHLLEIVQGAPEIGWVWDAGLRASKWRASSLGLGFKVPALQIFNAKP